MARRTHGIFCLEGNWHPDLKDRSSVEPGLEMLFRWKGVPYVHRRVATRAELFHYAKRWLRSEYKDFPILYLAFHGESGCVVTEDKKEDRQVINFDVLARWFQGRCNRKVIYFGSCKTLDIDERKIKTLIRKTGALSVCGFCDYVDWLPSTVFDLMVFELMQGRKLDLRGFRNLADDVKTKTGSITNKLKFRAVFREPIYRPRNGL